MALHDGSTTTRQQIVIYELMVEAIRSVLEKNVLSPLDEKYILGLLHSDDEDLERLRVDGVVSAPAEKRIIPGLKRLVEKELEVICKLFDNEEGQNYNSAGDTSPDDSFSKDLRDVLLSGKELSTACTRLLNKMKSLYSLYTDGTTQQLLKSLGILNSNAQELLFRSRELEKHVTDEMMCRASTEDLKRVEENLELALEKVESEIADARRKLEQYEDNKDELLLAAKQMDELEKEIMCKKEVVRILNASLDVQ